MNHQKDPMDFIHEEFHRKITKERDKERMETESFSWQKIGVIASIIAAVTGIASIVCNILQFMKIIDS